MIDPAMCRPGRLDKLLYVDLPSADERAEIVRTMTRKVPLGLSAAAAMCPGADMDAEKAKAVEAVEALVRAHCEGYSGADLAAVVREAGVVALRRTLGVLDAMEGEGGGDVAPGERIVVQVQDFERATEKVHPSVSVAQRRKYEALR